MISHSGCLRENWSEWDVCTDCEQVSKRTRGFVNNPEGCGDVEEETKPCADELTDCKRKLVYGTGERPKLWRRLVKRNIIV